MKAYYWSLTDRLHVGSSGHSFILSWQQFWHNYIFLSLVSSHAAMQHIETKFWLRFGQLPAQWFDTVGQWGAVISIFSSGDRSLVVRSPMHTTGYICILGQDLSWNVEVTQPLQAVMSHWNTSPMTTYLDNAPARQVLRCIALFQRGKKSRAGQQSRPGNSSRKSSALLPLGFQPVAAKWDSEGSATFQCNHHISLVVNAIQTPLHNIMNIEHSYWQHLNLCFNWHPNKIWCDWPQHLTKLQQKVEVTGKIHFAVWITLPSMMDEAETKPGRPFRA